MNKSLEKKKIRRTAQKEARRTVKQHIEIGDLDSWSSAVLDEAAKKHKLTRRIARLVLRGPEIPLEDKLKMTEYALLVDPISKGLRSFIENPGLLMPNSSRSEKLAGQIVSGRINKPSLLIREAGQQIYWDIRRQLDGSDRELMLDRLIDERTKLLPGDHARAISPLDDVLRSASISSAAAMYSSAVANALTVQKALGPYASYFDILKVTRNSIHLPLSRPLIHLLGQKSVVEGVDEYNDALMHGNQPGTDLLRYDQEAERVYLSRPIRTIEGSDGRFDERFDEIADAEVGCPVTFSPGLVKEYYETIVDLIDYHDLWPDQIMPSGRTYSIEDLSPM